MASVGTAYGGPWLQPAVRSTHDIRELAWRMDEIGYRYVHEQRGGYIQRRYEFPRQQAIAWEIRNQLHQIGLPETRRPGQQQGLDGWGRRWRTDELGYPFYIQKNGRRVYYQPQRRDVADRTRRAMQQVDLHAATSAGVRNAMLSALNATGAADGDSLSPNNVAGVLASEAQMRPRPFFESVVAGINRLGSNSHITPADATRFQKLLEQGVEDAVVIAFNASKASSKPTRHPALDLAPATVRKTLPQPIIEESREESSERPQPLRIPLRQNPPPPVGPPVRTSPAVAPPVKTSGPKQLEELPPAPARPQQSATPSKIRQRAAAAVQTVAYRIEIAETQTPKQPPTRSPIVYRSRETVDSGWVVYQNSLTPLSPGRYELRTRSAEASRVDIFQHGRLLMHGAFYARYYEDARKFLR